MHATWILVANASTAKLYQNTKRFGDLEMLREFDHPESRTKDIELTSDRRGNYQKTSTGHGTFNEPTSPKAYEATRFARELAEALEDGRKQNSYERIVVVAPPQFLGEINQHLNGKVRKLISSNLQKDYTRLNEKELLPTLREQEAL